MSKIFIILLTVFSCSCGARKPEKYSTDKLPEYKDFLIDTYPDSEVSFYKPSDSIVCMRIDNTSYVKFKQLSTKWSDNSPVRHSDTLRREFRYIDNPKFIPSGKNISIFEFSINTSKPRSHVTCYFEPHNSLYEVEGKGVLIIHFRSHYTRKNFNVTC